MNENFRKTSNHRKPQTSLRICRICQQQQQQHDANHSRRFFNRMTTNSLPQKTSFEFKKVLSEEVSDWAALNTYFRPKNFRQIKSSGKINTLLSKQAKSFRWGTQEMQLLLQFEVLINKRTVY